MKSKRVLFITQQIMPYVDESAMAVLGRKVPQFVQEKGREIRTFMPKWGTVNERRMQLHEVIRLSGMNLIIDETDHLLILKVASIPSARMQVYFIDNDDYFMRRLEACDANGNEYPDNSERAIFYARGVLETVKKLRWVPDIIHCQGWISAVAPIYIKTSYREEPSYRDSRIVFSPGECDLQLPVSEKFRTSLFFKGMKGDELNKYPEKMTIRDLYHMAIDYSDAMLVTKGLRDEELIAYAKERNIPVFEDADLLAEGMSTRVTDFFDAVWGEGKEDNQKDAFE